MQGPVVSMLALHSDTTGIRQFLDFGTIFSFLQIFFDFIQIVASVKTQLRENWHWVCERLSLNSLSVLPYPEHLWTIMKGDLENVSFILPWVKFLNLIRSYVLDLYFRKWPKVLALTTNRYFFLVTSFPVRISVSEGKKQESARIQARKQHWR